MSPHPNSRLFLGLAVLMLLPLLSSCYVPDKFRSELRLSRYGDYALSFDGNLTYAPILFDYQKGTITADNEEERNNNIYNDLIRDKAIKSAKRVGKGTFAVKYERMGRLGLSQQSTILNRNARMLTLKSEPNGMIFIRGASIRPVDAQNMAKYNIGLSGEFRVTTDANVLNHNANEVRAFGIYKVYIWVLDGPLSPSPSMQVLRADDPQRPLTPAPGNQED